MKRLSDNLQLIAHFEIDVNDFRTGKKQSLSKIKQKERLSYWQESLSHHAY